ncbi:POT-type proton-dependent oligopeptide transporter, partial [Burkholderia cenocepacia]|uniref:POT-type proton-dependent oligopeptide transporter n=1 Tax=Burkholderia cenocepacia TaxID=95486 RepID=UPI00406D4873
SMYNSLGVIVVGNGLFKSNAANLVRRIYEGDNARIDSAFTIYYMAVNIGSTASMLATPWIKDHWGWHTAFAVCCAGMALGILNFVLMHRTLAHIGSQPGAQPAHWRRLAAVAAGGGVLALRLREVAGDKYVAVRSVRWAALALLTTSPYSLATSGAAHR